MEIIVLKAGGEREIDETFAAAVQQQAVAIQISSDAFFLGRSQQIAALSLRHSMKRVRASRCRCQSIGQLWACFGRYLYRSVGIYVGRILKGERPRDLPVLQPTKLELVSNLKTAKALGLAIQDKFLARANEVIE